jgi:hypothetical protein
VGYLGALQKLLVAARSHGQLKKVLPLTRNRRNPISRSSKSEPISQVVEVVRARRFELEFL